MSISSLSATPTRDALSANAIRLSLQQMIPSLAEFGRKEEAQFVQIGEHLADFLHRSRAISRCSAEVIDSLLRKEGDEVFTSLDTLLAGLDRHIVQLLAATRTHEASLLQVTVHINRIESPLKSLCKVVKILYSLSFSTKVESTHGHSVVVLQSLAEDLKTLAIKINTKTDSVRDRLKMMSGLTQRAREKTQTMAEVSLLQAGSNLQQCRHLMDVVASRRAAALIDARLLQDYSSTLSAALSEVVSSIQFHDITRQQVDHVQLAIHDFCRRLTGVDTDDQLAVEVGDLCRIQSAQLCHTRYDLVDAVLRMINNLRRVAPAVEELAQKTRSLSTSTETTGANFFRDAEPVLTAVTSIIAAADEEDRQAVAAVAAVLDVLGELSQLLQDVESIGTEMKMISFNAGITAAHNLDRGAGLGVIARSIQNLSSEVLSRTQELSAVYGQMERLARELNIDTTSPLVQDNTGSTQLNEAVTTFMARLQQLNRGVVQLMTNLDGEALSLATDVMSTADKITIHVEAGKIIDRVVAELESLSDRVQVAASLPGAPKILDLLSRNYTMQSERKVHAEVRKSGGGVDSSLAMPEHGGRDLTGLGENVELF